LTIAERYELEGPLGHGAMATVDLARDVELDRPVALKRLAENLARDAELRARFLREARLAARLAHPNVVRVYDVGEDDGRPFIAMEYVDGETLADLLARRGELPPGEAAALGVQICRALEAAHAAGLVHRDVKPHNLLLRKDGQLKLGDFGIAFGLGGTRLTTAGTVLGTAAYLAPEQARGEDVTAAADLYGLGAVLYELLTGRPPRTPSSVSELAAPTEILAPPGAPRAISDVVMRCLEPDPRRRPRSAAEVERALSTPPHDAPTRRLPSRERRRPTLVVVLVAGAFAAIGGGVAAAFATQGNGSPPATTTLARVTGVRHAPTAEQQARNLAAWLRRNSR
jgi:eukaryotic-like serine/threonine-protein kinase